MKRQRLVVPLLLTAMMAVPVIAGMRDDRQLSDAIDLHAAVRTRGVIEIHAAEGSLPDAALDDFTALSEKGVAAIVRFTDVTPPKHVVIYLSPHVDVSHTYPHFPSVDRAPRLFIDSERVADRSAPYLHELVHAVMGNGGAMWLEEGFASWVASSVATRDGGYYAPVLSRANDAVDAQARAVLSREAMRGATRQWFLSASAPDFATPGERRAFYIAAHSFTRFLAASLGTRELVRIHRANDIQAIERISGVSIEEWRQRWLRNLL